MINKHLMTGPEGDSEFCFPETLDVSRGYAKVNIEVEGKQNSLFPAEPVGVLLYFPTQNQKKTEEKSFSLLRLDHRFAAVSRSTT